MDRVTWSHLGHAVHTVQQNPEQNSTDFPALLLVHGFGASTDHWRHNIPVLAETHAVHAIDLLGFGRSAKPAGLNYGGALWRDQLMAYVRERIGRPTVIAGFMLIVAIIGKVVAGWAVFGKQKTNHLVVGLGMLPRGEVGLIFLGLGTAAKLLSPGLEAAILLMVIGTTFLAPVLLRLVLKGKPPEDGDQVPEDLAADPLAGAS